MQHLLLAVLGTVLLGGVALVLATWVDQWPRLRHVFIRLGDATVTFALGFLGFILVVLVFRALGWLPPAR
jgi:hypothetical protein